MDRIFKRSSLLILAQTFCRGISFFYTVYVAKSIGVENFGLYTVALSYFSLVLTVSDLGLGRYLIREIASSRKDADTLFSNVLVARLTLLSITVAVFSILIYIFDPLKIRVFLSLIAVIGILPTAISLTFENFFIARSNMKLSTWGLVIFNLLYVSLGIFFLREGLGVFGVLLAGLVAEVIYVFISYLMFRELNIKLRQKITSSLQKEVLLGSLPYGFLGILGLLYFKIDNVMLSYLRNSYEAGIYGAGYKFLEAVVFIPASVSLVSFPAIAKMHEEGGEGMKEIFNNLFKKMGILGLSVMGAYLLLAPILPRFLPQYSQSVLVIRIIALSIPFMFLHVPLSQLLLSSDKFLRPVVKLSITTVSFNIILNFIFIPKFGFMAASWITVFSDIFSLLLLVAVIKKEVFNSNEAS